MASVVQGESRFTGGVVGYIGTYFLALLLCLIPIVGFAIAFCYFARWQWGHTVIDGRRMRFDGKWTDFWVKSIIWALLTIVTLGIFAFWIFVKIQHWIISNVHVDSAA